MMKSILMTATVGMIILSLGMVSTTITANAQMNQMTDLKTVSDAIKSVLDPGIGHEMHQLAIILPPIDSIFGFSLIVAVSVLAGMVLTMNIYRVRILRNSSKKMGGGVLGSIIGSSAGACGCGPIGFAVISSFGSIGGTAAAFLTNYEIPIRLAALAILGLTLYTTTRSISIECKIKN